MSDMYTKKEIDVIGIFLLLWSKRKRIAVNCIIAGVLALVVAFSLPKKYTSTVVMAPEMSSTKGISGSLGSLASMAGLNLGGMTGGEDAIYPEIYPQIVSSTPFLCDMMTVQVETNDGELNTTLYDYLSRRQKTPWWTKIYAVPIAFFKRMFTDVNVDTVIPRNVVNNTRLSRQQFAALSMLDKSIVVSVDKGNDVVTLNVTMQDPKITADIANLVAEKLQEYIVRYRSAKARKDLEYAQMLYDDSKVKYIEAQKVYADYVGQHQNIVNMRFQVEADRLENEKELAFGVYNQMAQNLEVARAKVQEETPVCVVVEPAYIQINASSPKKVMMGLLYVFLAFFGTSAWIIIKDRIINR